MRCNLLERPFVISNYQMNVIGEDRASVNRILRLLSGPREPFRNAECMYSVEQDRGIFKSLLRRSSQIGVMWGTGDGFAVIHLGRFSESEQFPRGDPLAPGAARIVGEPEAVGAENEVGDEESHRFLVVAMGNVTGAGHASQARRLTGGRIA
jgi:hypothetical protein